MGTRYHVSLVEMKKLAALGLAVIDKPTPVYVQQHSEEWDYTVDTDAIEYYIHGGSIGKWAFDGFSYDGIEKADMLFTGPNVGKGDLATVFKEHGIDVNYS